MIWLEKYKSLLVGAIVIGIALFLFISHPKDKQVVVNANLPLAETDIPIVKEEAIDNPVVVKFFVDVKGAIKLPGLYEANEDDRVFDIIQKAGGLLDNADEGQINFAQKIYDEMVIYIPMVGEEIENPFLNSSSPSNQNDKVNLNKANSSELETLPGIGPSKAAAIIEFREQNGPFKQIEDLQKISGIGPKTFERLQDLITVK
ncbi:helix-hairpin-helix domain-containing protein [Lederbergia wuyishanensis]|uniref:Competence protein ComEA n=1 Tax=Lederbergia wuyishanensis TaxID=1347903 RepID=A0ABU0D1K6_9BACI|nr:helix-hairpin-helix domain-containing protein [Lederbergia wuyishanensis]MCJ8006897.1 helix-hairpin-helix domain-containing protein [Lederbergia wuyishanensis]MDQ0342281.1 competence protein ComEA [Lederbergia wuyishanensis]